MGGFDLGVAGFIVAGAPPSRRCRAVPPPLHRRARCWPLVGAGVLGALAGYVCHRFRINPLVVTLAMGTIAVGIVQVQNGGLRHGNAAAVADRPGRAGDQDVRASGSRRRS